MQKPKQKLTLPTEPKRIEPLTEEKLTDVQGGGQTRVPKVIEPIC